MDTAISPLSPFAFPVERLAAQLGGAAYPLVADAREVSDFNLANGCGKTPFPMMFRQYAFLIAACRGNAAASTP